MTETISNTIQSEEFLSAIKENAAKLTREVISQSGIGKGSILVVGCSSSEIIGEKIGTASSLEAARATFSGIYQVTKEEGIYVAAQCCEHLNRAIIIEKRLALQERLDIVNVVPQPKAGGSFATTAYEYFDSPVAVEHIKADAGIDIGDTLIGMHLHDVAVPLRTDIKVLGNAHVVCARTRPKYIGGARAKYLEEYI